MGKWVTQVPFTYLLISPVSLRVHWLPQISLSWIDHEALDYCCCCCCCCCCCAVWTCSISDISSGLRVWRGTEGTGRLWT